MKSPRFEVAFHFDGGLASVGELDASDHEAAAGGARRLLAANIYCFLNGQIPKAATAEGRGYHVIFAGSRKGSIVEVYNVVLDVANSPWVVALGGSFLANAYAPEFKAGVSAAKRFVKDSIRAALGTGPVELPEFVYREPPQLMLAAQTGNHEPLLDIEQEIDYHRQRLRELTGRVLLDLSRAVGRSAESLKIFVDGELVGTIGKREKSLLFEAQRRWMDDQIGEAVSSIKLQRGTRPLRFD